MKIHGCCARLRQEPVVSEQRSTLFGERRGYLEYPEKEQFDDRDTDRYLDERTAHEEDDLVPTGVDGKDGIAPREHLPHDGASERPEEHDGDAARRRSDEAADDLI